MGTPNRPVDYDREKLQERLAKLSGGVEVIRVGAPTEAELKSRREALDDAISATKAAMAEGVVPGGGLTLLRAIEAVEREEAASDGDERTGLKILKRALEAPTRQIAENSAVDGGVVVRQMREGTGNHGFDAATGQFVDLVESGIVDPAKVVRLALENAVSVVSVLLLTEATMTEIPEEEPREPGELHPDCRRPLPPVWCRAGGTGTWLRAPETYNGALSFVAPLLGRAGPGAEFLIMLPRGTDRLARRRAPRENDSQPAADAVSAQPQAHCRSG